MWIIDGTLFSGGDDRIHIWDWRFTPRPQLTLDTVSKARQVCWERIHGHLLASSHFDTVNLWDRRNASRPIQYINAHPSQVIHALDFSTNRELRFVSSGADKSVKFWNVKGESDSEMEWEIQSPVEIWKIRYTPFGDGLVTLSKDYGIKDQNTVMLWSAKDLSSPVHQFIGHSGGIIEFCWRFLGDNNYQLVSYADDLSMRIWHIDARLKDLCHVDYPEDDDDGGEEQQAGSGTAEMEMEVALRSPDTPRGGEDADSQAATESEVGNSLLDDGADNIAEISESRVPSNTQSESADLLNGNDRPRKTANEDEAIFKLEPSALARTPSLPTLSTAENSASVVSTASLSSEEEDQPMSAETTSDAPVKSAIPPKAQAIACERRDSGVVSSASNVAMSAMTVPANRSTVSMSGAAVAGEGASGSAEGSAASSLRVPGAIAGGGAGVELASSAPELHFEPAPLLQEFKHLHLSDNLVLEKSDVGERVIIIVGKAGAHRLRLRIDFPAAYPMAKPHISMEDIEGTLGGNRLEELKKRLVTVAEHHFSRTKRCVEMCQRQFEILVDGLIREEQSDAENDYVSPLGMLGGMRDSHIPFPRTCGARFDGADKLVVFGVGNASGASRKAGKKYKTPRSFSAIASHILSGPGALAAAAIASAGTPSKAKGGRSASVGEGAGGGGGAAGPSKLVKTPSTNSRRSARSRSSAGSSISEDLRPLIDNCSRCVLVYNCLATQPFNMNLAKKYCMSLKTMPANCYTNLGIAFNEARRKKVRIQVSQNELRFF